MKKYYIALLLIMANVFSSCSKVKWTEFSPPEGEFSILMPGAPQKREATIPIESYGNQNMVFYSANVGEANFSITYSDYPSDFVKTAGPDVLLGAGIQKFASRPDSIVENDESGMALNCPTRKTEVNMVDVEYKTTLQSYLSGNRVYLIQVVRPYSSIRQKDIDRFVSSFRISNISDEK